MSLSALWRRPLVLTISIAAGLVPCALGQDKAEAPATLPAQPAKAAMADFIRSTPHEAEGRIDLEVATRWYTPVKGEGPTIYLVGAVHIGTPEFYAALQKRLDSLELVLFEGVKPPGVGALPPKEDGQACAAMTEKRLRLGGMVVEQFRGREGRLPETRAEIIEKSVWPSPNVAASLLTDGWGREISYTKLEGGKFDLASLGADGKEGGEGADADVKLSGLPKSADDEKGGGGDGIQARLAKALDLKFQLKSVDYARPHFVNSDLSIDEVQAKLEEAGMGASSKALFGLLSGEGFMGKLAGLLISFIEMSPQMKASVKVMMVQMLGSADLEGGGGLGGLGGVGDPQKLMKVIITDRNRAVLDDLKKTLAEKKGLKTLGIFYGSGHYPSMEQALLTEFGYARAGEEWTPAISADLKAAGMTLKEAEAMQKMMQGMMSPKKK